MTEEDQQDWPLCACGRPSIAPPSCHLCYGNEDFIRMVSSRQLGGRRTMADITYDDVRVLLGQRVKVTLSYPEMDEQRENLAPVISVGTLIGFGQGGDFEILEDDGFVHYCWPLLDIKPEGKGH